MKNIAVYGGSFNPPTLAHAKLITEVLDKTQIEKIILTPSGDRLDKDHCVEHVHRREIIKIFFELLKNSGLDIEFENHFLEGNNGSHTTTLQEEIYFKDKLGFSPYFIYGSDVAENMQNWSGNKNNYIQQKLKKIFINRPGYPFDAKKHKLDNYLLLDIPDMLNISSSIARELIKNKQDVKHILNNEVEEYIEKNNLYNN